MDGSARTGSLPEISIVMAAYNEEMSIGRAIDSIQAQTFANWELIVVDDGSTDATREIVQRYATQDQRIILISNKDNLQLSLSLNRGIGLARADFIARADADDLCLPKRLAMQYDFLQSHPDVDVLGTGVYLLDRRNRRVSLFSHPSSHADLESLPFLDIPFEHPSVMYRKRFFDKAGVYDPHFPNAEDKEIWIRGLVHGCRYANLPEPLIDYQTDDYIKSWRSIARHTFSIFRIARRYRIRRGFFYCCVMAAFTVAVKLRIYRPRSIRYGTHLAAPTA